MLLALVFAETLNQEVASLVSGGAGSALTGGIMGVFAWFLLTKALPRIQDRYEASLDKLQAANSDAIKLMIAELREARVQAMEQAELDRKMRQEHSEADRELRHEHADRLHAAVMGNHAMLMSHRAELLTEFRKLECYQKRA